MHVRRAIRLYLTDLLSTGLGGETPVTPVQTTRVEGPYPRVVADCTGDEVGEESSTSATIEAKVVVRIMTQGADAQDQADDLEERIAAVLGRDPRLGGLLLRELAKISSRADRSTTSLHDTVVQTVEFDGRYSTSGWNWSAPAAIADRLAQED